MKNIEFDQTKGDNVGSNAMLTGWAAASPEDAETWFGEQEPSTEIPTTGAISM